MSIKVNVDNFSIGPRYRGWLWNVKRRSPVSFLKNRIEWHYYPKNLKVPGFPLHVDFESSSTCNMSCSMCFRQRSDYDPNEFGIMDFDIFKKGLDECAQHNLYSIRLSWRGECLTNPNLVEMIRYAKKKGIKEVSFITNGLKLGGELAKDIVIAGVDYITVSVDGLHEEYDDIRAPAKFADVVNKLKNLRMLRDSVGGGYPRIRINSVWNENKGERWFADMYKFFKDIVDFMTFTPEYDLDETAKQLRTNFTCQYPFQRISIMWDGTIPLCISDKKSVYQLGCLSNDNIYDVWHGKKMEMVRKLHVKHNASNIRCCSVCDRAVTKQIGNKEVS